MPLPNGKAGFAVHHPFDGDIHYRGQEVSMTTRYPKDGHIRLDVSGPGTVKIRIPAWAKEAKLPRSPSAFNYLELGSGCHEFDLVIALRLIYSHPHARDDTLTLAVGPLIYCLKDVDNQWETRYFKHTIIHQSILIKQRGHYT